MSDRYGPCCHDDTNPCLCQRFFADIKKVWPAAEPVASQRVRDIMSMASGFKPGELMPVKVGENVNMLSVMLLARGEVYIVFSVPVSRWTEVHLIANNRYYNYQPPIGGTS